MAGTQQIPLAAAQLVTWQGHTTGHAELNRRNHRLGEDMGVCDLPAGLWRGCWRRASRQGGLHATQGRIAQRRLTIPRIGVPKHPLSLATCSRGCVANAARAAGEHYHGIACRTTPVPRAHEVAGGCGRESGGGHCGARSDFDGPGVSRAPVAPDHRDTPLQDHVPTRRSLGDADLKAAGVTAEPEVTVTALAPGDTFLILASDGLWDVVPNHEAVGLVLDTGAAPLHEVSQLRIFWASNRFRDVVL